MNLTTVDPRSAPAPAPGARDQLLAWQTRFAQTDWIPWLIIGFAALLRFFLLDIKPPHFDEGINGWFVDTHITKGGSYKYDPTNYHGPLHFYLLFLSQTLFGRNLWALRLPVVLGSLVCVWLTLKFEPLLGRYVSRMAALAMAVSPGFVFYGRYSIHEVWLVLFSMLFILGLLGLWRFGTSRYLWCAGMGLTGMILTKETYIIHIACALIAVPCAWLIQWYPIVFRRRPKEVIGGFTARWFIPLFIAGMLAGFFMPRPWAIYVPLTAGLCALVAALLPTNVIFAFKRVSDPSDARPAKQTWDYLDLALVAGTGIALIIVFYSGTFFHWDGLKGLYRTYAAWFATGTEGRGHEKPWYYWLRLMPRYELPVLAGLALCVFCQRFKEVSLRYLAIYGVGTLMAYSIVKYKSPWCIISFIWPFLFIFGAAAVIGPLRYPRKTYLILAVGLVAALAWAAAYAKWWNQDYLWTIPFILGLAVLLVVLRDRFMTYVMSGVVLCASLGSTIWLNYFRCTTDTEPYVYVQTYNDIFKLTRPVLTLAKQNPVFYQMKGHMIRASAYPFPWILDDFPNVGYYEHQNVPTPIDADFLLVQEDRIKEIEAKLQNSYFTDPLRIRPYQDTSKLYLDARRFKSFFPGRQPDFLGKGPG